ncbi:MAG: hypothetical protein ABI882_21570 [Acidobacteriota bacterium]
MTKDRHSRSGASSDRFPVTRQSAIFALKSDDQSTRASAYDTVLACYWKPTYKLIRLKWQLSREAAEDLTQGFFATAFEKKYFERYDPELARFHTFLRTCVERYVANQRKYEHRLKRSGGVALLSLDFDVAEEELAGYQLPIGLSMDEYLYREWIRSLLGLAIETLRTESTERGRLIHFSLFERYDLSGDEDPAVTYQGLASEFGLTATSVTNYLASIRRDFRRIVLDHLRALTASDAEFRDEARHLLGIEIE